METTQIAFTKETAAHVLGQVPSGVFIVTTQTSEGPIGMMASWVQQVGFEPLKLAMAVHPERALFNALKEKPTFLLHLVAEKQPALMRAFGRPSDTPFDGLQQSEHAYGPVLHDALGVVACKVVDTLEGAADHAVVIAEVETGVLLHEEAKPFVHLRQSASHY